MKNTVAGVAKVAGASVLALILLSQFAFDSSKKAEKENEPIETYKWHPPAVPTSINFAGEPVPVERWDVKERFDRELLFNFYNQANVLFLLKLSNRYFPVISERLAANGVPDDFKYLCVAESNLLAGAISRSGAVSFWQFLDKTAPEYNLVTNSQVDERYDVEKATDAACKYFKQAYARFGTWTAAAAAYNCGQGGYSAQATYQQTKNYYDLQLPEETNRYIYRILTYKHLMSNAEQLGFALTEDEKYPIVPTRNITVSSSIPNLAQFAIDNGTTYKMVKLLNPWLRSKALTVSGGKTYNIKVPAQ